MKKLVVFLLSLVLITNVFAKDVLYPNINGLGENAFGFQLLKLVLSKVDGDYSVKITPQEMNQDRAFNELERGVLSVVDSGIGKDIESRFAPVYIPIDMGLTGWRIFIIHKDNVGQFAQIKNLNDLKRKVAGQGTGWTDGLIIENSGIRVMTAPKIDLLIKMVNGKRFDFFPLGVNETHGFLKTFGGSSPNLVVEDNVVLVYPFARLYYVNKSDSKLHADIMKGLEMAYDDGSYKNFIENHPFFKEGLDKSDLKNRTVIRIDNPFMTDEFKNIDSKWFYKLDK